MKIKSIAIVAGLLFAVSAQAQDWQGRVHWTGSVGDSDYYNAANWVVMEGPQVGQNVVPAKDGTLDFDMFLDADTDSTPEVVVTNDTTINTVHMGGATWITPPTAASDVTFTIDANFTVIFWFVVGEQFGSHGTINLNGGSLTVGNDFEFGDLMIGAHQGGSGILNVNGGAVITCWNLFYSFDGGGDLSQQFGHINLSNGTINVHNALITNDRGYIDITEGQLNIAGNWEVAIITNQVAWGHIKAYGGDGEVLASYNAGTGMTEITATEPLPLLSEPTCWIDASNLYWSSTNTALYSVDYKTDLVTGAWQELTNDIAATPFTNSIPLPTEISDPAFFRVHAYH
ncbi:MAG: hypothetical protein DRP64_04115 [Verrucomicrobia bacterium]|nr:MAG: hypothetical protein DRP64_04115 [Verrucomicrobiota bacterium]